MKLECASFLGQTGYLGLISDPLIISKFPNETHDPKGSLQIFIQLVPNTVNMVNN